jgi:hypothetical protein
LVSGEKPIAGTGRTEIFLATFFSSLLAILTTAIAIKIRDMYRLKLLIAECLFNLLNFVFQRRSIKPFYLTKEAGNTIRLCSSLQTD